MIPLPDNPPKLTSDDEGTKDQLKLPFVDTLTANSLRCQEDVSKTFAILEATHGAGTRPAELAQRLSRAIGWYLKQAEKLYDCELETPRRGYTSSTSVRGSTDRIGFTRFSRPPPGHRELASVQVSPAAPSDLPAKTPHAPTPLLPWKAKLQQAREARDRERKARLEQAFKEAKQVAANAKIDYAAQFRAECRSPPKTRVYTPYEQVLKDGLEAIINDYHPNLYYPTPDEEVPWTGLIESITMEIPRYYAGSMSKSLRKANATYYGFERTVVRLWKAMMWEQAMILEYRGTDWMRDGGLERMWALAECMDGYIPRWAKARLTRCDGWSLPSDVMTWWPVNGETNVGMSWRRDVGVATASKEDLVK